MKHLLKAMTGAALIGFVGYAGSATITVGTPEPDTGNCYPFGCSQSSWDTYLEVYNASAFPGTISITGLAFFHTQYDNGSDALNTGTYDIYLSTTSKSVGGLDTSSVAANQGSDNALVFSGSLPSSVAFGDSFTLNLLSSFTYDPSLGNLLMTVTGSGIDSTDSLFLDSNSDIILSRAYLVPGGGQDASGLVTGFVIESTVAAPEPASLALVGIALAGVALAKRRKLRASVAKR